MSTKLENKKFDVVIIGAGLSGLSAAYTLLKKNSGLTFAVIEAKDRIGGRAFGQTLKCAKGSDTWDLGGQWIGSCQPHVMKLIEEMELDIFQQYTHGRKIMQLGTNEVSTYKGEIPSLQWHSLIDLHLFMTKIEKFRKTIPMNDPSHCPRAKEWDNMTMSQAVDQFMWTKGAKEAVIAAGRVMFGVEPSDMSFLYYLMYIQAAGGINPLISAEKNSGQEYRVKGGAFQICDKLADAIGRDQIHLNQPASHVVQNESSVAVYTTSGTCYECDRLIMAVPPHQAAKLEYSPPLPVEKIYVLQRMPVGYLTKVIITYKKAFWREKGYSGEFVTNGGMSNNSTCDTGPLCVGYDATSSNGNPALVAFIGGNQQLKYAKLQPNERKQAVLQCLQDFFGSEVFDVIDYCEKNWNEEPYNGGCPVSVATPGVMSHIVPGLRSPFNRIHFAGTESATVWCGFFNGAVQAGQRAACEILFYLRPSCLGVMDLEDINSYSGKVESQTNHASSYSLLKYITPVAVVAISAIVLNKMFIMKQ